MEWLFMSLTWLYIWMQNRVLFNLQNSSFSLNLLWAFWFKLLYWILIDIWSFHWKSLFKEAQKTEHRTPFWAIGYFPLQFQEPQSMLLSGGLGTSSKLLLGSRSRDQGPWMLNAQVVSKSQQYSAMLKQLSCAWAVQQSCVSQLLAEQD